MCPNQLGLPFGPFFPANPKGCWLNVGGPGATQATVTHSHALAASYNGNTVATVFNNGVWRATDTILPGEIRGFTLGNAFDVTEGGRHKFRKWTHRYEFDGASFSRHVGVGYAIQVFAPAQIMTAPVIP